MPVFLPVSISDPGGSSLTHVTVPSTFMRPLAHFMPVTTRVSSSPIVGYEVPFSISCLFMTTCKGYSPSGSHLKESTIREANPARIRVVAIVMIIIPKRLIILRLRISGEDRTSASMTSDALRLGDSSLSMGLGVS